ncbi:polysaccharide biosynthesis C-terminal domain-containing protein [Turicibacter sanguinis]|uniref:oligosaccharide flippase family protein n=1 Tax=Turicibacter sanguinis TaxID=154288 RepID=UPI001896EB3C|nr:polysaccharide biosynthesis C-terminal domain-containing protein [Turicibacter sanguinis]
MKVIKNYLYNTIYQIILIISPIITVPYITRIFTPDQLGINAFTLSIAQYFVLFAGLGIGIYGNRTIAYIKEDENKRVRTFWSIFFTILFTTFVALILYFFFVFFIFKEYFFFYLVQSIYILSVALDISWLFRGMEDFKKIVTRNIIIKLIGITSIFLFVKKTEDIYIYISLLALINLLGVITMWIYLPQYIKGFYFNIHEIKSHVLPLIKVYIPQVAIQVYVVMDKTMLGILSDESQVGYYDMSQKIVKIVLTIVTSLGVVMIPHISNLIAKKNFDEVEKNIGYTFKYMSYLAFPLAFGLSLISKSLTHWFFGANYEYTGVLMSFSSFIIISITWSNIIGMQLLMPMMKEKEFSISVIGAAVINVVMNIALIPKYGALGAIISTIVAEFSVTLIQIIVVKKYINVLPNILSTWKCFISAIIMFISISQLTSHLDYNISTTIIQIIAGFIVYVIAMVILKSQIQIEIIDILLKKFK